MNKTFLIILFLLSLGLSAQIDYEHHHFSAKKKHTVQVKSIEPSTEAYIISQEAPSPNGQSYRSFLAQQKIKQRALHPIKKGGDQIKKTTQADAPILERNFPLYRQYSDGSKAPFVGGVPNDNTMAISNDGMFVAGINSVVWAYDFENDTVGFEKVLIPLKDFDDPLYSRYYDPKLIYDPDYDRYILVFLKGSTPALTNIVVCFSQTNDPDGDWNVYLLEGNPLNDTTWTDYPAISLTKDEFFITGNLIIPDVSWQVGFNGSIIWQIDKQSGFEGANELGIDLYSKVSHNGKLVRNLHPVRGAEGIAEKAYFLSNRNFDLENDTIFFLEVDGTLSDPNRKLKVDYLISDIKYGVPPNGIQADTDTTDPTAGLQTNDARVLGAFLHDNKIQFVANSIDHSTGHAAVYHGKIDNAANPSGVVGKIISDPVLDFGYPNIAYTGAGNCCEPQCIIGFNFTSATDFAGVGMVYHDNEGEYSDLLRIIDGEDYVNRMGESERWGDYFGMQRKFNEPGKVYGSGFYGINLNRNATYVFEASSPDSSKTFGSSSHQAKLFPNPTDFEVKLEFFVQGEQNIDVVLLDLNGRIVEHLITDKSCSGLNTLVFYTPRLNPGTYVVQVIDQSNRVIMTEKFVKY